MSRAIQAAPLTVASAGAFVASLSTSLVLVSTPAIARDLGIGQGDVSWVLTAYLLTISALLAASGRAADVLGRKRIYLTGFAFFIAGSAMCSAATNLFALVGSRVFQGVGAAMLMAVGPAIVTRAVPPAMRARGLGIQLAATYVGLTLGPSIGGAITERIGWHAVFIVIAGVGGMGGAATMLLLDEERPPEPVHDHAPAREVVAKIVHDFDPLGALLLGATLTGFLLAVRHAPEDGIASKPVLAFTAFGVVALVKFVRHEHLHPSPILPLGLLKTPAFAFGVLGAALFYAVHAMLAFLVAFELQREGGMSPAAAGIFITAQAATMVVVVPLSGALTDRFGARAPSIAGMLAMALGLTLVSRTAPAVAAQAMNLTATAARAPLASIHTTAEAAALAASLVVCGLGAGLFVAPNSAVIMGAAPRERQGTAGAMAATARNVGMTCGIAAGASLGPLLGFERALVVATVFAVLGALVAAARPVLTSTAR